MAGVIQRCSRAFLRVPYSKSPLSLAFCSTTASPNDLFEQMVKKNTVVVFMKGISSFHCSYDYSNCYKLVFSI